MLRKSKKEQQIFLEREGKFFPKIVELCPRFMGPPLEVKRPNPNTPATFNQLLDVCKNLEKMAKKQYAIHEIPRGALYMMPN